MDTLTQYQQNFNNEAALRLELNVEEDLPDNMIKNMFKIRLC